MRKETDLVVRIIKIGDSATTSDGWLGVNATSIEDQLLQLVHSRDRQTFLRSRMRKETDLVVRIIKIGDRATTSNGWLGVDATTGSG